MIEKYFVEGGIAPDQPFKRGPMPRERQSTLGEDLLVAANFVEVHLAREGHSNAVGINFLEKIQVPTPTASVKPVKITARPVSRSVR